MRKSPTEYYGVHYEKGDAEAVVDGHPRYGIMNCVSCGKRFVAEDLGDGWSAVYPIQHKSVADDLPEPIRSEFDEANLCYAVGAYRATVTMCHTAMEAVWRMQKASGLNELKEKGIISERLFAQATEIRLWAGIAKHEAIYEVVSREDAEQLLVYMEDILDAVYVQPARLAALSQKREKLPKETKPDPKL